MKQAIQEKKTNKRRIVLSIDAMGGDLGPPAVVAGVARSASKNPNLHFILHGNQDILNRLISRRKRLNDCVESSKCYGYNKYERQTEPGFEERKKFLYVVSFRACQERGGRCLRVLRKHWSINGNVNDPSS